MLNKDIIRKRLELLYKDVREIAGIKFETEELYAKPDGIFECSLKLGDSFASFTYTCDTNSWWIKSDDSVESYDKEGSQFDALIYKLTTYCPWFRNLHPDPYYYDTNFFVYSNSISYNNRYPASNKQSIQGWIEFFEKDNSIFIENANTGQIYEIEK